MFLTRVNPFKGPLHTTTPTSMVISSLHVSQIHGPSIAMTARALRGGGWVVSPGDESPPQGPAARVSRIENYATIALLVLVTLSGYSHLWQLSVVLVEPPSNPGRFGLPRDKVNCDGVGGRRAGG